MKLDITNAFTIILSPQRSLDEKKKNMNHLVKYLLDHPDDEEIKTLINSIPDDTNNIEVNNILFEKLALNTLRKNKQDSLTRLVNNGYMPPVSAMHSFVQKYPYYDKWKEIVNILRVKPTIFLGFTPVDSIPDLFYIEMMNDVGKDNWFAECENAPFNPNLYTELINEYSQMQESRRRFDKYFS